MLFQTVGQHRIFLWMLSAGAAIGAWYALTALLRRLLQAGLWLGLLCDIAFGLGAGALFCLALYAANYGALRGYAVLAAALGFIVFAFGPVPPAKRALCFINARIRQIFVKIRRNRWINVIFK